MPRLRDPNYPPSTTVLNIGRKNLIPPLPDAICLTATPEGPSLNKVIELMDRGDDCTPTRQCHVRRDGGKRHVAKASQPAPTEKRICDTKSRDQNPTGCTFRHFPAADTGNNGSENEQRSTSGRQVSTPKAE
uniref:Uncharacterized protein n=1 Tax=Mesocestoides corti TaxID=53468 RepID=A0A5K3FII1_MESCO